MEWSPVQPGVDMKQVDDRTTLYRYEDGRYAVSVYRSWIDGIFDSEEQALEAAGWPQSP